MGSVAATGSANGLLGCGARASTSVFGSGAQAEGARHTSPFTPPWVRTHVLIYANHYLLVRCGTSHKKVVVSGGKQAPRSMMGCGQCH